MKQLTLLGILCLSFFTSTVWASTEPSTLKTAQTLVEQGALNWDKKVQHGQLNNGMNYIFFDTRQDAELKESNNIHIQLVVHAGSSDELPKQHGVAHMIEHLAFRSTQHYPDSARAGLQRLGGSQGQSFNAMTKKDMTRFMLTLDNQRQLESALSILKDMTFYPLLTSNDFELERPIILEEWRSKLSANQSLNQQKARLINVGTPTPIRSVIGTEQSIKTMPIERIRAFHQAWYTPNNMTLVLMGPLDSSTVTKTIERLFSDVPYKTLPTRQSKKPALPDTLTIGTLTAPQSRLNRVAYLFRLASPIESTLEDRRQGLTSYLTRKLLTDQVRRQSNSTEQLSGLRSNKSEIAPQVDAIAFANRFEPGQMQDALTDLLREIERLKQHGFYQDDFSRAQASALQTAQRNIVAAQSRGIFWLSKMVNAATYNTPIYDATLYNQLNIALLKTITLDDVNQMLQQWLNAPNRIAYLQKAGNNQIIEPLTTDLIQRLCAQLSRTQLAAPAPFEAVKLKTLLAQTQPRPAVLQQRQAHLGVSQWQLANGDNLWLLDTNSWNVTQEDNKVRFRSVSDVGYSNTKWEQNYTQILTQMIDASGLEGWTDQEEQKWRQEFHVNGQWHQEAYQRQYNASVDAEHLQAVLAYYQQTQALKAIDPEVYKGYLKTLNRRLNSSVITDKTRFRRAFAQHQFEHVDDVNQTLRTLVRYPIEHFSNAARQINQRPVTYFIAAKDAERYLPILSQYLGAIERHPVNESITKKVPAPTLTHQQFTLIGNQVPRAHYRLEGFTLLSWQPQLVTIIPNLADEFYAQLKHILRSEEQGIYSLKADIRYDMAKQGVNLSIAYSSAPNRAEELATSTQQVLNTWTTSLDRSWLAEQKTGFSRIESKRRHNSESLLRRLQLSVDRYGSAEYLDRVKQLPETFSQDNLEALLKQLTWPSLIIGTMQPDHDRSPTVP